jgi:hypothetical protein
MFQSVITYLMIIFKNYVWSPSQTSGNMCMLVTWSESEGDHSFPSNTEVKIFGALYTGMLGKYRDSYIFHLIFKWTQFCIFNFH